MTNAVIHFFQDNSYMCSVYHHGDGYPDSVGRDLKDFIKSREWTRGIDGDCFNGAGCFVAQYIKNFKYGSGNLYMHVRDSYKGNFNYNVNMVTKDFLVKEIEIFCDEEPDFTEIIIVNN
jgi:hypothetical protein